MASITSDRPPSANTRLVPFKVVVCGLPRTGTSCKSLAAKHNIKNIGPN